MSGAEFAFVMGILSGTITVVDSIVRIYISAKRNRMPQAFRDAALKIPFFQETLKAMEHQLVEYHISRGGITSDVKGILQHCKANVEDLEVKFRRSIPQPCASRIRRIIMSARAHRDGEQVAKLTKWILDDIQLLGQRLAIQTQLRTELTSAVSSLSSSSPTSCSDVCTSYRQAHRYPHAHSTSGDQNLVFGSGVLYVGCNQIFNLVSQSQR